MNTELIEHHAAQAVNAGYKRRELKAWHDHLFWIETRPHLKGDILIQWVDGKQTILIDDNYALGNAVHEYGGGDYTLDVYGNVFFVCKKDQQIYQWMRTTQTIEPITHGDKNIRYADLDVKESQLLAIREMHVSHTVVKNEIVMIDTLTHGVTVVATGHDFYACPRFEVDGKDWAYLAWDHPKMPWDECQLWVGQWQHGSMNLINQQVDEVISQYCWHQGQLVYVSDRSGWANVYLHHDIVCHQSCHFGLERWQFGGQTLRVAANGDIIAIAGPPHQRVLGVLTQQGWQPFTLPCCDFSLDILLTDDSAIVQGHFVDKPPEILKVDLKTGVWQVLVEAANPQPMIQPVTPEYRRFRTLDDNEAHAFFYDAGTDHKQSSDKPPLLVLCHGGPTAATSPSWDPMIQFWLQMGFSVIDVNYRGSTGYGRAYQDALKYRWGELDLADCVAAVRDLIAADKINPKNCFIRGKSSGGLTALMGLILYQEFSAGASYYGVTDLMQLMNITHKFEKFYLDDLIGPYPAQQAQYQARSPVNLLADFNKPVIFFHGLKDAVVPPEQTEEIVAQLTERHIDVVYHAYPEEKHGFKAYETKKDALSKECKFYLLNCKK